MSVNAVDQTTGNTTPLAGNTNNLVGNLSALTTNTKSDAVGAINEVNQTKQNATDNNLQTTDKTIVGGINELRSGLTDITDITDVTATVNSELIDNPSLATIYAKKQGKLLFVSAYINPRTSGGVDVASNTTIFTLSGVTLLMEVFCSSNSSNGNPTRLKLGTNGVIKNESPMKNAEWYSMSFVGLIN